MSVPWHRQMTICRVPLEEYTYCLFGSRLLDAVRLSTEQSIGLLAPEYNNMSGSWPRLGNGDSIVVNYR